MNLLATKEFLSSLLFILSCFIFAISAYLLYWCILQLKSLEKCKEKFRTLPALNFDVTNDLIKHFSRGNYHQ